MAAAKFSEAQIAFVLKQTEIDTSVAKYVAMQVLAKQHLVTGYAHLNSP